MPCSNPAMVELSPLPLSSIDGGLNTQHPSLYRRSIQNKRNMYSLFMLKKTLLLEGTDYSWAATGLRHLFHFVFQLLQHQPSMHAAAIATSLI